MHFSVSVCICTCMFHQFLFNRRLTKSDRDLNCALSSGAFMLFHCTIDLDTKTYLRQSLFVWCLTYCTLFVLRTGSDYHSSVQVQVRSSKAIQTQRTLNNWLPLDVVFYLLECSILYWLIDQLPGVD